MNEKQEPELLQKLFEAGKLAGQQQVLLDKQAAAMTKALRYLADAHQALHLGSVRRALVHIAKAMEVLA